MQDILIKQTEEYIQTLPFYGNSKLIYPTICVAYLFSLRILSNVMKYREPVKIIRYLTPVYNIFQVVCNSSIILYSFSEMTFVHETLYNLCGNTQVSIENRKNFIFIGYLWCLIKISDFLDTIFFVLCKKMSHVSFLHVYHHSSTMMIAFLVYRFLFVEQAALYAGVNCAIHVVMYSYYFLTSIGLKPKWKKLVTVLQLLQFLSLLVLSYVLLTCQKNPKYFYFSIYGILQCVMYLYLFMKFFYRAYSKTKNN